tara:strand:- start:7178 stop:7444 length:267 start_codon:yes stop_codon:yes gene_type:complete
MGYITSLFFLILSSHIAVYAQSSLLEGVKRNPKEALALCKEFKSLNSRGISASSKGSIMAISRKRKLSTVDAEILSMYVRGLHCPEVN